MNLLGRNHIFGATSGLDTWVIGIHLSTTFPTVTLGGHRSVLVYPMAGVHQIGTELTYAQSASNSLTEP
jgi:hypothetical protein